MSIALGFIGALLGLWIARLVREEGMSAIIVEQNPRLILPITARAVVLDRGSVVHAGDSAGLLADRERLDRWLAVAQHAQPTGPQPPGAP